MSCCCCWKQQWSHQCFGKCTVVTTVLKHMYSFCVLRFRGPDSYTSTNEKVAYTWYMHRSCWPWATSMCWLYWMTFPSGVTASAEFLSTSRTGIWQVVDMASYRGHFLRGMLLLWGRESSGPNVYTMDIWGLLSCFDKGNFACLDSVCQPFRSSPCTPL